MDAVFDVFGKVVLAITIIFACLTSAIGSLCAFGEYFSKVIPVLNYQKWFTTCALESALIANVGLHTLLTVTIPVLLIIYPVAIILIVMTLLKPRLELSHSVMIFVLIPVGLISSIDGLYMAGVGFMEPGFQLLSYLLFQAKGFAWLLPGVLGGSLGVFVSKMMANNAKSANG